MERHTQVLVQQASRGSREAKDAILMRYLPEIRAFIRLRTSPKIRARESCSDLVQSVCVEVLNDIDAFEYRSEGQFRKWLYMTALRKVLDREKHYGRHKRDVSLEVPLVDEKQNATDSTPSHAAIRNEEQERLERAFDQLPEDHRVVISLVSYLDLTYPEVGEIMKRSPDACRVLHNRALARLGILLQKSED